MSGIAAGSITGVVGDVLLAGNNTFTGTNVYDTNRPTSSIESTPTAEEFITKQNADLLYAKQFKFHQQTARSSLAQQVIGNSDGANPPDSDANFYGGALTNFVITGIEGRQNGVKITWEITGEWDVNPYDKGLIVYKEKVNSAGTIVEQGFLRADAGQSKQVRWVSPFVNAHQTDTASTMDTTSGTFIDTDIVADFTYKYTPVLVNSGTANSNFYLNGTRVNSNAPAAELACSVFGVQEF
jgi:hypothetical protein